MEASQFKVLIKVSTTGKGLIEVRKDWPVFKVSTVVVDPATRVLGDAVFTIKAVYLVDSKINDSTV